MGRLLVAMEGHAPEIVREPLGRMTEPVGAKLLVKRHGLERYKQEEGATLGHAWDGVIDGLAGAAARGQDGAHIEDDGRRWHWTGRRCGVGGGVLRLRRGRRLGGSIWRLHGTQVTRVTLGIP